VVSERIRAMNRATQKESTEKTSGRVHCREAKNLREGRGKTRTSERYKSI